MSTIELLERLVYLDLDFISSYYECMAGQPLPTQFAQQEGKKAGAQIPIFSAELSAVETKPFKIGSIAMLEHIRLIASVATLFGGFTETGLVTK